MRHFAHASAWVDDGAQVSEGTQIWHFCHVSAGARLGERCVLGQNLFVADRVTVWNDWKIQNNVSLHEGVILEDAGVCGPSMVFTNVKTPRAAFPRRGAEHCLTTRVGRGASIGANATVVCKVTIGAWAFAAAGAVVTRDVPPYALVVGVPARRIGWACECGATLRAASPGPVSCAACQRAYTRAEAGALNT